MPSAASAGLVSEPVASRPGGGLADDQQRGDRKDQRENGQCYRLGPDRLLDGCGLRALVGGEHVAPGGGKPARE